MTTKEVKKDNFFKKVILLFKNHMLLSVIFIALILIIIFLLVFRNDYTKVAVVIGEDKYSVADVNMSLYNLKYSYFGLDASDIPDASLEEELTTINMNVSEYLKTQAISELKYRSAISRLAKDNNITLSDTDISEVKEEQESIIDNFGSYLKFKKFLRKNGINEDAYYEYLKANKLYEKVLNTLYSEDGKYYFKTDELEKVKKDYENTYYKVNQIVLAIVDVDTKEPLSEVTINQKETLIKDILKKAKGNTDFELLVEKYSEETSSDNVVYFKSTDVLEEVYSSVSKLKVNEISDVIKTDYAYSIIKRLKLDDGALEEYLDSRLKEKFNEDIVSLSEDYKVIYENVYKKVK